MNRFMSRVKACETVAKSLREFGYPDVTGDMIAEVMHAWVDGKRGEELPHGIIGRFAESQFDEIEDNFPGTIARLK